MYERRLLALGYPNSRNFNPNDLQEFQALVLWLEEQKIRRYPVDSSERNGLRNFGSNQWQQFFEKYAKDLQCPDIARETNVQTLCWILGYALRLEAKYGSERTSDNPLTFLDNIDAESQEFKNGVTALADLLKIPPNPDPIVRLEACSKLLETRLSQKDEKFSTEKHIEIKLKDHDFGFSEKNMDPVLKEAAKILRLLHLTNLRKLQSEINNTIELVQNVTANPKTDTKSGKVGR